MATQKGIRSVSKKTTKAKREIPEPLYAALDDFNRISASTSSGGQTSTRGNSASSIVRTGRFANIESGVAPFAFGGGAGSKYSSNISMQDVIMLCQKAYWNVPIFRNTIDLMTEFAMSPIYFTGGNKESKDFFDVWAKKIDLWQLSEMFFREYFRSGNVFIYKLYGNYSRDQLVKLKDANIATAATTVPIKYIILNPCDINVLASSNFANPTYTKVLNKFELGALMRPQTREDEQMANAIPELKSLIKNKNAQSIVINLDDNRLVTVFYKKQDYEPLAVPLGFPVLDDINWKLELKRIDMAISRTVQQVVLLVTQGDKEMGPPTEKNQKILREIFENGSVGRTLIADYTTNVDFKIPQIGDILDPKKYEVVDRDIRYGLNNVLFGDEKFSNTSVKLDVFFKRIEYSRQEFMTRFVNRQIEQISKEMRFKSVPKANWRNLNMKDNSAVLSRVYTRLLELGAITPQEAIEAIRDNRLPNSEDLISNQEEYKKQKDAGMFVPLLNNNPAMLEIAKTKSTEAAKEAKLTGKPTGRPPGASGTPKSPSKSAPIGKKTVASYQFSIASIPATLKERDNLCVLVGSELCKKYKVKKLNASQKQIAEDLADLIVGSELKADWEKKIKQYIDNPVSNVSENEVAKDIFDIASYHGVTDKEAAILFHSKA